MIVTAKLIKRKTNDGLMEVQDSVPTGRIYKVNLKTKKMQKGMNLDTGKIWDREMVIVEGQWFPTELLEIEDQDAG